MEAQEFGEMIMEHVDEVNFALDGLRKPQPVRIRRASLLSICATCTAETPLADSRRNLIYAASQGAEEAFKKTVEVDRLMDTLRDANPNQLQKLVVENVLAFNEGFWIHLAARTDTCKSEDDKKDYEELAISVMSIVDCLVHKTKEINQREQEGQLDEGFLSEVNAQLRQAKEDVDKPGLEAMLQKVLQLYASRVLSKRSYAKKGEEVLKAEQFLQAIIKAPEEEWNKLLINGMTVGKGDISPDEFYAVIKKRIKRTLIRTEGGSYQQHVLTEYLKGIQSRAEEIVQVLQGKP
ncbi:uncharacterized protein LOC115968453 isoform X4 [Quercus lobata]|uniref:uncharacterized protein LOC115968453 isoform X4 n=1 Tax=Quercus lobata TaxID=97700 RepID=UPI00124464FF|nr:uncharacterized protein LOC115968453 isoform X4 [Quercus lobata]